MPPKRKRKPRKKSGVAGDRRKEALLREMKMGVLNTERYNRLWRDTLLRIKLPEIRRNVEIAWGCMERTFDLKDYSISFLLDALQEVEDQRRRANGARVETFDRSLRTHEATLKTLDAKLRENLEKTLAEKNREFDDIEYSRSTGENILRRILCRVNDRTENALGLAKSVAIGKINTFTEDGENERRVVAAVLEKRLEDLWTDLRNVFADYRKSSVNRRKAYNAIRRKDEFDRRVIIVQWQRIANLLGEITKFRENIRLYREDTAVELREIIREADFFHDVYHRRNERFVRGKENDKRKALTMSKEYDRTVKRFNKLINKAERMLSYIQICRKYETEDEQILPTINQQTAIEARPTISQTTGLPVQLAVKDFENSIKFWHRVGLAQLIANELRIERDRLALETNDLRNSIARYFYTLKPTSM